jgi:cysteine synthase B
VINLSAFEAIGRLVGNTPLLPIAQDRARGRVAAKLEYYNPSGSVKDRAALGMLQAGLRDGRLGERTIIDATSGNTGISLAMFGSALGLPVLLVMPENVTQERRLLVSNYGAQVHYTSRQEGTDGAQRYATELAADQSDRYFYVDQYKNEENWRAHYRTTGPEIWQQTDGKVTHFVAGLGTSGTFVGTARFLRERGVRCISVQPDNPLHGLEGWKHMQTAHVPAIYDPTLAAATLEVDTEDAFRTAVAAGRYLGLPLSPSAAANLWAAQQVAAQDPLAYVVTTFADSSLKYLGDSYWTNDDYLIDDPFR